MKASAKLLPSERQRILLGNPQCCFLQLALFLYSSHTCQPQSGAQGWGGACCLMSTPSVLHDLIWEMGVEITQAWGYPRFGQMVTFHLIPNKLVTPGDTATYPRQVGHLSVRINLNMDHEGRNTWSQRHYKISTQNLNFIFVSIVKHFLFSLN